MLNKKLIALTIILVSLLAVSAVSATDNATSDVVSVEETTGEVLTIEDNNQVTEQSENEEIISTTDDGTFTALQNKIDNAEEGSTITLENDYVYDEGFSSDGIFINKQLTINGNGHTINGLSKSRIFYLRTDSAVETSFIFNNIKFCNAKSDCGGAIYADSHLVQSVGKGYFKEYYNRWRLTINDCEFSNNNGAASAIYGDYLTIINSKFISNDASYNTIFAKYSSKIIGSNFENGGRVYMSSPDSNRHYEIIGCNFKNNTGAVYCYGDLTVSSCNFDSNTFGDDGGAINCFGHLIVKDSNFTNNQASGSGGAIYQSAGKANITNSNFENNKASEDGGAVHVSGYLETRSGSSQKITIYNTSIENSFFTKNIAGGNGGAIDGDPLMYAGVYYDADAIRCTFNDNKASNGKDVYGTTTVDCVFIVNVVIDAVDLYKYYGGSEKVTVRLTKDYMALPNVYVQISANGKTYTAKTDSNGRASVLLDLPVGSYDVVSSYEDVSNTSKVTVKSTITTSDASGTYSNSKVTSTFLDTEGKTLTFNQVTFKVGDKSYSATTNSIGVATANIPLGVGTYTVTAVNPVNNEQKTFKLAISKADSKIALTSTQNKDITSLTATLTPTTASGNVVFNVNGENKNAQISNGKATLTLGDLEPGNYTVTASYSGDKNLYASTTSNTVTFNIAEAYPILTAQNLTKTYGNADKFVVNLIDSKGNAIANALVNVDINGKATPITTGSDGQATMPVTLAPAEYTATVTYGDVQTTAKITIKKATPKMTAKAKAFKKSVKTKKYTVTLKTNKNKVMKNKRVTLKVNKKTYSAKTNSKGVATFKITKLTKKGKYTATVAYSGSSYYNKLTKKVKITVK